MSGLDGIAGDGSFLPGLLDDAAVCLVIVDEDFRVQFMSAPAARFLGFDPGDVVGRIGDDFLPPDYAAERRALNRRVIESGQTVVFHETLRGWRCRTRVRPFAPDASGLRRVAVIFHPIANDPVPGGWRSGEVVIEARNRDGDVLGSLTRQEIEVLRFIGAGLTSDQIAAKLCRSRKTIEFHRASLGRKLGVGNRVELALIAIRAGLVPLMPSDGHPGAAPDRALGATGGGGGDVSRGAAGGAGATSDRSLEWLAAAIAARIG